MKRTLLIFILGVFAGSVGTSLYLGKKSESVQLSDDDVMMGTELTSSGAPSSVPSTPAQPDVTVPAEDPPAYAEEDSEEAFDSPAEDQDQLSQAEKYDRAFASESPEPSLMPEEADLFQEVPENDLPEEENLNTPAE